ncbi:unnamed protein product, partial [Staurois parvus]
MRGPGGEDIVSAGSGESGYKSGYSECRVQGDGRSRYTCARLKGRSRYTCARLKGR